MSRFSTDCTRCPRLARFLAGVRARYPGYHARPVPAFGPVNARLLIVGLAPGLHGANATGRPFTGDEAGRLLYRALHKHGLASEPESRHRRDGLQLVQTRITNAVRCVPPANRPTGSEVRTCNAYLQHDLARLRRGAVVLALGRVAHAAVVQALGLPLRLHPFAHGAEHALPGARILLDSYHCSRYNTQTRRLTPAMFDRIIARTRALLT
jgi:uracil-DNA glycosylase family 4